MIKLEKVMELNQPFISAGSGLVEVEGRFFVIADDENFLGVYDLNTLSGKTEMIFNENLPLDKSLRKKHKRDFEALVFLSTLKQLLLIPSGSTTNRERGALMNQRGEFIREVSFHALYSQLGKDFSELNIEGGVVVNKELWLFQRGNGPSNQNAVICFDWQDFILGNHLNIKIISATPGLIKGVNLTFTDATIADKNILFLAVAENSQSTYLDGEVTGSVLGIMNLQGEILTTVPLNLKGKPEGLCYRSEEKCCYLVTDDDDRLQPSALYKMKLPDIWDLYFE